MMSQSQSTRNGTLQAQPIIIIAITLFAFSGLMVGFTVGAFAHIKSSSNNANQTPVVANRTTPTPTPTLSPTTPVFIHLGPPDLTLANPTPNPGGTQAYSVSIQAKDKDNPTKLATADGITCRLWLVPQGNDSGNDPGTNFLTTAADQLQHPEHLNQQFPQEIQNALVFNPTTQSQVQPCVQGSTKWTFTLSPSVTKGNYYVVGLTDWQGKSYNWTWKTIVVGDGKK